MHAIDTLKDELNNIPGNLKVVGGLQTLDLEERIPNVVYCETTSNENGGFESYLLVGENRGTTLRTTLALADTIRLFKQQDTRPLTSEDKILRTEIRNNSDWNAYIDKSNWSKVGNLDSMKDVEGIIIINRANCNMVFSDYIGEMVELRVSEDQMELLSEEELPKGLEVIEVNQSNVEHFTSLFNKSREIENSMTPHPPTKEEGECELENIRTTYEQKAINGLGELEKISQLETSLSKYLELHYEYDFERELSRVKNYILNSPNGLKTTIYYFIDLFKTVYFSRAGDNELHKMDITDFLEFSINRVNEFHYIQKRSFEEIEREYEDPINIDNLDSVKNPNTLWENKQMRKDTSIQKSETPESKKGTCSIILSNFKMVQVCGPVKYVCTDFLLTNDQVEHLNKMLSTRTVTVINELHYSLAELTYDSTDSVLSTILQTEEVEDILDKINSIVQCEITKTNDNLFYCLEVKNNLKELIYKRVIDNEGIIIL